MEALYYTDWKWAALRGLMRTIGRTSEGIALGLERGFDSGEMMEYIYRNQPRGSWGIGLVADWVYLNQVGCRGLRGRKRLLQNALRDAIQANRAAGRSTHVLDIAGGPAAYLLEVIAQDGKDDLTAEVRDLDTAGLERGRLRAMELGVRGVTYRRADALDPALFADLNPAPNVIVASGFYEILVKDELVRRSLRLCAEALAPGGVVIFTTQVQHPQLELIANVLNNRFGQPWVMKLRAAELVEGWAAEAGLTHTVTATEPLGLFSVTVARRGR